MYLDFTPSHYRYAAYETTNWDTYYENAATQRDAYKRSRVYQEDLADSAAEGESRNDVIREQIEREYGLKREQLSQQMSIARMNSSNSRAATASAAKNARAQIKLATRQLEEIGIPELELKKYHDEWTRDLAYLSFGMDIVKTATEYNSTPDKFFQARDFEAAIPGLLQGGVQSPTAKPQGEPTPNNLQDLVARLTGGKGFGAPATSTGGGTGSQQQGMIPTSEAAQAIIGANPPSPYAGLSEQDSAALRSIGEIYKTGLDPYALDALNPTQAGMLVSGGRRLGWDPKTEIWRSDQKRIGQGSSATKA